ncbi:MAG: flagellar protein FliS [Lachnospiraceae bacterium]|nr:flagellar protein FliS [Lachnospiraceae bacterium]
MTREKIQEFTLRVSGANKTEMIVILYDIALTYAEDAKAALERSDTAAFRVEIGRIRNTLRELMDSVNTSADMGMNILKLYIFCNGELTRAYMDCDMDPVFHVVSILTKLREAYEVVSRQDKTGPVMENTEKVYSGLTYNRSLRSDDVSGSDVNRGYFA